MLDRSIYLGVEVWLLPIEGSAMGLPPRELMSYWE